jgi:hypothetical protein
MINCIGYVICVNGNVRQKACRLSTAKNAVNRLAGSREKGFDGIEVVWHDGVQRRKLAGLEFLRLTLVASDAADGAPDETRKHASGRCGLPLRESLRVTLDGQIVA